MGKKIDTVFEAVAQNGKMIYRHPDQVEGYCNQFEGKRFLVTFKQYSKTSEKLRLWAYLHGCLIDCIIQALEHDGWEGVSEKVAYGYIKRMVGQKIVINPRTGKEMSVDLDFSEESADRLHKLVNDTISLLRNVHDFHNIPDSESYKARRK